MMKRFWHSGCIVLRCGKAASENGFVEKDLSMNFGDNPTAVMGLLGITLFVDLIAGSYPALFLSRFELVKSMVFFIEPYMAWNTLALIRPDHVDETMDFLKQKYGELNADGSSDFHYTFLNDRSDQLYRTCVGNKQST